jgi:ribose transport system substrate-binding protein
MRNVLSVIGTTAAVIVLALAASCSREPAERGAVGPQPEAPKGKIGVTCMDLTNPFFKLIANVMAEEAAKYGYQVVSLDGNLDPAKQNSQLADFVAQGFDAIFLNPVDSKSAGEGVKKAFAAGIPVFTYDVQVTDPAAGEMIVSHVGSDNFQGGMLAADSMIKATGDRGKIAIISYPEVTSCILRVAGFKESLKKHHSNLQIVTELSGKGNRNDGYAVATDILQAHPDIVGIFAINDPSALGAYAAVYKAGRTGEITIVAFDASPAGKQAVFEKKLYDSPQQFPREMAKGTVQAFVKYLEGAAVEKKIFIPCSHYHYETSLDDESRIAEQW